VKKLSFRLQRVLDWRAAQVRVEEVQLSRLREALQAVDGEIASVQRASAAAQREILAARSASGAELALLNQFREHSTLRTRQLAQRRAAAQQAIDRQMEVVTERRRQARLLERLRERRVQEWRTASEHETEADAAEGYLLRWNRSQ